MIFLFKYSVPLVIFPVPGPGVLMVCGGLYVLSTEFEGAKVALSITKRRFAGVLRRFGVQVDEPLPAVVEDKDALKDVGVLCRVGIQVDESIHSSK